MGIDNTIEELNFKNEELDWEAIRKTIIKIAKQNIGGGGQEMFGITVNAKKLLKNGKKQERIT